MTTTPQKNESLNELHLFAGAGGGILGGILLGHTCICAVEIEPYCRSVLLQRQRDGILPRFPIWDDVRTFDGRPWRGRVDVVCGGFPCQDISSAGNGEGISGKRSGLWNEMRRIICEVQPGIVFVENSPMLSIRGIERVLGDLAEMGFDANWGVLGCGPLGAPHLRERLWLLAWNPNRHNESTKREILRRRGQIANTRRICWWDTEPKMDRVANGVAGKRKRNHSLGNGQVPAVAAVAWDTLSPTVDFMLAGREGGEGK